MPSVSRLDFPDKGTTNKEYSIHKGMAFHTLRSNESKTRLVRSCWIYSLGVKFKSLLCLVMQVVWLCSWKSVFLDRNEKSCFRTRHESKLLLCLPREVSVLYIKINKLPTHIHVKALYANCKLLPRKVHVFILADIF